MILLIDIYWDVHSVSYSSMRIIILRDCQASGSIFLHGQVQGHTGFHIYDRFSVCA
jgi:hypothetical protein